MNELLHDDRRRLLVVAREALVAHLEGRPYRLPAATGALAEARGAFVSLHRRRDDELRGCVGLMEAERPLVETIARMAVAAARDHRFEPVTRREVGGVALEISVLGPLRPVSADEVQVGRDGLVVSRGRHRGVLLPQVPEENGWDRETFLARACGKAGLPEDAWREKDVTLQAFTAEVFGEDGKD